MAGIDHVQSVDEMAMDFKETDIPTIEGNDAVKDKSTTIDPKITSAEVCEVATVTDIPTMITNDQSKEEKVLQYKSKDCEVILDEESTTGQTETCCKHQTEKRTDNGENANLSSESEFHVVCADNTEQELSKLQDDSERSCQVSEKVHQELHVQSDNCNKSNPQYDQVMDNVEGLQSIQQVLNVEYQLKRIPDKIENTENDEPPEKRVCLNIDVPAEEIYKKIGEDIEV